VCVCVFICGGGGGCGGGGDKIVLYSFVAHAVEVFACVLVTSLPMDVPSWAEPNLYAEKREIG